MNAATQRCGEETKLCHSLESANPVGRVRGRSDSQRARTGANLGSRSRGTRAGNDNNVPIAGAAAPLAPALS